jgi:hypothetical protein
MIVLKTLLWHSSPNVRRHEMNLHNSSYQAFKHHKMALACFRWQSAFADPDVIEGEQEKNG